MEQLTALSGQAEICEEMGLPTEGAGTVPIKELRQHLRRDDSTGIGLEVADKVLEAHGGTITAQNHSTGGALVELHLPLGEVPS